MKLPERPLAFVDVETTGLDPSVHEIIEVAVVFDRSAIDPTASWAQYLTPEDPDMAVWRTRVRPARIQDAEPMALQINGYRPEDWEGAPTAADVAPVIEALLTRAGAYPVIAGHNVPFDRAFLDALLQSVGSPHRVAYHLVDTATLCYAHLVPTGLTALSLDSVRKHMGIPTEGAHAALKDAIDARTVYRRLVGPT